MKVTNTTTIELSPNDIRDLIVDHLLDKGYEIKKEDIKFKISSSGSSGLAPGISTVVTNQCTSNINYTYEFDGCSIVIDNKN